MRVTHRSHISSRARPYDNFTQADRIRTTVVKTCRRPRNQDAGSKDLRRPCNQDAGSRDLRRDRAIKAPIVETYGDRVKRKMDNVDADRKMIDVDVERKMIDVDELVENSCLCASGSCSLLEMCL